MLLPDRETVPVRVLGITDAKAIAARGEHSCALHQDGTISCWGSNDWGQLGDGNSGEDDGNDRRYIFSSAPVEVVGITDAISIAAGGGHSCALRRTGTISCWGDNYWGQLGNGRNWENYDFIDGALELEPIEVTGITDAIAFTTVGSGSASSGHSCALHQDGTISCWGSNRYGELGNGQSGDDEFSLVPVRVKGFGG